MGKHKQKQDRRTSGAREPEQPVAVTNVPMDEGAPKTHLTWICALVVLVATWMVFEPALDGQWLRWDDDQLLLEHDAWRGFSARHLAWMFTTFHMGPYQPLSWLSYAIDHACAALDARAYHRTNVLLHAATAVSVFFVARALFAVVWLRTSEAPSTRRVPPSFEIVAAVTALVWSLHPLRVESVAWITERRDCLSGLFFALTLCAWLAYARGGVHARRWYWLAVIAFAASLLSKGLGLTLPLVLLALDAWPLARKRTWAALLVEKAPFLALSAAAAVLAFVGQKVTGAMVKSEVHDFTGRVVQAFYGLAFYVRKTLWPEDLMVLYPMSVPLHASELRFVLSITAVVIVAVALFLARRRAPAAAVACASYLMIVAPVLGLVQTGSQLVADRYSYLATIPLVLLAGGLVVRVLSRNALWGGGVLFLFGVALVPLSYATARQIHVWHDTLSLWQHDLAIDPGDNPGRRNLIVEYERAGQAATDPAVRKAQFERGIAVCRQGSEIAPDAACLSHAAKLYDLLAGDDPAQREHYLQLGLEHALHSIALVERTLQRLPEAYEAAGVILTELGRPEEAVPHLQKLVTLDPRNAMGQGILGEVLMQTGRVKEALVPLEAARSLNPESTTVDLDLGDAYRQLGDTNAAVAAYRRVVARKRAMPADALAADLEYRAALQALVELGQKP